MADAFQWQNKIYASKSMIQQLHHVIASNGIMLWSENDKAAAAINNMLSLHFSIIIKDRQTHH